MVWVLSAVTRSTVRMAPVNGSSVSASNTLPLTETLVQVIVVLTADCLERCEEEDDFVRHEIRHAIEKQKNIITVFEKNFQMNALQELPSGISKLSRYNG